MDPNHAQMWEREKRSIKDFYTGKHLYEYSITQDEFEILLELNRIRLIFNNHKDGIDNMGYSNARYLLNKESMINYMRGLKHALDIITTTKHAWELGLNWQAFLY